MSLDTKIKLMKFTYFVFGPCALFIGGFIVISPDTFWELLRVNYFDPLSQTLYGAVLCGVGIISLMGIKNPLKYIFLFQFLAVYKTILVIALVPRLILLDNAPIAGWIIAFLWFCMAVISVMVFPWGKWEKVLVMLKDGS